MKDWRIWVKGIFPRVRSWTLKDLFCKWGLGWLSSQIITIHHINLLWEISKVVRKSRKLIWNGEVCYESWQKAKNGNFGSFLLAFLGFLPQNILKIWTTKKSFGITLPTSLVLLCLCSWMTFRIPLHHNCAFWARIRNLVRP